LQRFPRSIGRAVLDYQKLEGGERLRKNALDRIAHAGSAVANRQQHTHYGICVSTHIYNVRLFGRVAGAHSA
jgi:hypothetical protein